MANEPPAMVSAYPDPPSFYTHFTKANLTALRKHRTTLNLPASAPIPASSLPTESPLQYLIPPPMPTDGSYWSFAEHWQFPERHPKLEDFGIQRLFSDNEEVSGPKRVIELRRMIKSLLLSFLELVGVMAVNPQEYSTKTADIQTILFNMHYLINQYRPHQARETLIMEMEEQLERVRRETEENREATRKVDEALLKVEEVSRQVRLVEERGEVHRAGETGDEKAKRRDLEGWELMMGAA